MDPNQSNVSEGSQGPSPGWNPYMCPFPCPTNWLPPGYQQIPMINPSGTGPKVTQLAQMKVPASPDNDDHEEVQEVPPPSAQEKTKKGGTRSKQGNFNLEED
ncbi:hypothetical protein ACP4OV_017810 [Aristida adscensionis]